MNATVCNNSSNSKKILSPSDTPRSRELLNDDEDDVPCENEKILNVWSDVGVCIGTAGEPLDSDAR